MAAKPSQTVEMSTLFQVQNLSFVTAMVQRGLEYLDRKLRNDRRVILPNAPPIRSTVKSLQFTLVTIFADEEGNIKSVLNWEFAGV
ncbi:hypothetical protein SERLA73DRAFT_182377, partial [Serpula lacrymans var. lacrymans S7.3]